MAPVWSMGPDEMGDVLAAAQTVKAQLDALSLAVLAEADRQDVAKSVGAANTAAWLSSTLRLRPEEAGRAVKLARDLDAHLPSTREALAAASCPPITPR